MRKIRAVQAFGNEIFKEQKLTIGLVWEISGRSAALGMKQATSFWNRNFRLHRKR